MSADIAKRARLRARGYVTKRKKRWATWKRPI